MYAAQVEWMNAEQRSEFDRKLPLEPPPARRHASSRTADRAVDVSRGTSDLMRVMASLGGR